jgi:hypothetical protein
VYVKKDGTTVLRVTCLAMPGDLYGTHECPPGTMIATFYQWESVTDNASIDDDDAPRLAMSMRDLHRSVIVQLNIAELQESYMRPYEYGKPLDEKAQTELLDGYVSNCEACGATAKLMWFRCLLLLERCASACTCTCAYLIVVPQAVRH